MTGMQRPYVDRNTAIAQMYRNGMTLVQIGEVFGVTRERVRQVLKRYYGMSRFDGGMTMRIFKESHDRLSAAEAQKRARDERHFAKWGMTVDELAAVSDLPRADNRHPLRKFESQRKAAKNRGVEWGLTFKQWWNIWQESGHWHERGRGKGYCMARHGDTGGYTEDNVYICTIGQNFSDSYLKKSWDERFPNARKPKGAVSFVRLTRLGNFLGWQVMMNRKYLATVPVRK